MGLTLERRKADGKYIAKGTVAGVRIRRVLNTDIKRLAEDMRIEMEVRAAKGLSLKPERKTFADAAALYRKRPKGLGRSHGYDLDRLVSMIGGMPLMEINTPWLHEWQARELGGLRPASRKRVMATMRAVLRLAHSCGWCPLPLFPSQPSDRVRVRWLSEAERHALLRALPEHLYPIVLFLLNTGARIGEAVALDWSDIVGEKAMLASRKGTKAEWRVRGVPLNKTAKGALELQASLNRQVPLAHRKGPVFRNMWGDRWAGPRAIEMAVRKAAKTAGIEGFTVHDLRHTFASSLVQKGVNLKAVADLLGHASVNMVSRYAHLAPSQHREAVELLD